MVCNQQAIIFGFSHRRKIYYHWTVSIKSMTQETSNLGELRKLKNRYVLSTLWFSSVTFLKGNNLCTIVDHGHRNQDLETKLGRLFRETGLKRGNQNQLIRFFSHFNNLSPKMNEIMAFAAIEHIRRKINQKIINVWNY